MNDEDKTKKQMLAELIQMRRGVAQLEEAEEALQQSESKYRTIFDQATDGIMMMRLLSKYSSGSRADSST